MGKSKKSAIVLPPFEKNTNSQPLVLDFSTKKHDSSVIENKKLVFKHEFLHKDYGFSKCSVQELKKLEIFF